MWATVRPGAGARPQRGRTAGGRTERRPGAAMPPNEVPPNEAPPHEAPPPGSGTVPSGTLRFVRNGLRSLGVAPEAVSLQVGAGAPAVADEDAREPTDLLSRLWRLGLAELDDPLLGLHLSEQWSRGSLDLHDYLFGTAATLGEGLALAVRYAHIVSDSAGANDVDLVEEADGRATLRYQVHTPFPEVDSVASQFALAALFRRARSDLGAGLSPLRVGFASAPPRGSRELAAAFGTDRIHFLEDRTTMTFARADLERPLPGADPALARILRAHADSIAAAPPSPRAPQWRDGFRQLLTEGLADRELSVQAVARQMTMSRRTLQRRLEEEGTSWRQELDAVRREQAERMLQSGLDRSVMADRLGYSDTRALRRALHRWLLATG